MFKKQVVKPILWIMLGGVLMLGLPGCGENKNSQEWIENKVSEVSRVYPTENLSDLFNEFPEGFSIYQEEITKSEGQSVRTEIKMYGNPKDRTIKGNIQKIRILTEPYSEKVLESTGIEYRENGFIFENQDIAQKNWKYGRFLFQNLALNKKIFEGLQVTNKSYNSTTTTYDISYKGTITDLNSYFSIAASNPLTFIVSGAESNDTLGYKHSISIRNESGIYNFRETISELEEDN